MFLPHFDLEFWCALRSAAFIFRLCRHDFIIAFFKFKNANNLVILIIDYSTTSFLFCRSANYIHNDNNTINWISSLILWRWHIAANSTQHNFRFEFSNFKCRYFWNQHHFSNRFKRQKCKNRGGRILSF